LNGFGSDLKTMSRPAALPYPPSSVETPVCRPIPRTPCHGPARSLATPQREVRRCAKTDLNCCRNW
jgi:hypothetical protein